MLLPLAAVAAVVAIAVGRVGGGNGGGGADVVVAVIICDAAVVMVGGECGWARRSPRSEHILPLMSIPPVKARQHQKLKLNCTAINCTLFGAGRKWNSALIVLPSGLKMGLKERVTVWGGCSQGFVCFTHRD